jgi:transcriptional regulator with GAF, ATPase, and Fis domain
VSRSIVQRVIGNGQPLRTVDAASDERLTGAASVHTLSLRSVLAVPLKLGGDVAGVITLDDRMRPFAFGDSEVALLSDLADLASIALDAAQRLRAERRTARRLAIAQRRLDKQLQAQTVELASLRRSAGKPAPSVAGIVGSGERMQPVLRMIERVASADVPVLIRGESGTGKELVARAIHATGPRASAAFVSENCGAIPEPLLESALFGHVRGAFTGADRRRLGLFEIADGGTLFLDEIGEMTPAMQARLLRVLENGEVRPVGSDRTKRVHVRVIAATHRDLEAMVKDGSFREDLYYRLSVVTIAVPPLRERPEDIAPLVAHFVDKHAEGKRVSVEQRALSQLTAFRWPGNVRQLENEVRRALVLADDVVGEAHLSPDLVQEPSDDIDELDLKAQVDRLERRLIRRALDTCGGNQTQAARALGVSRYGLQKMLRRLDL